MIVGNMEARSTSPRERAWLMVIHRRTLGSWLALLVWLGGQVQAAEWPVPRGPSREPVPYKYDAAVWKEVPRDFLDDAPACILYSGSNYLIEPDGTTETIIHEITRLNSRKAIENLGEYRSIYYTPAFEKLTLNEARVIKADGRTIAVEPRHVQLRDSGTDFQVYDHSKQLIVSFPSLEVGDLIEVKWTNRGKNPEYQGHFFTRYNFGSDDYPIVSDELRIRLPKDKPLKYAIIGGKLEPVVREEGDFRSYHWRAVNRPMLPRDEHLPSKEELRLQVSCSTFASWEDVARWKRQLRQECWQCPTELRKIVAEVTQGLTTPQEKAKALTYWVRRHIRYVSVGERHDYTPHLPADILANRFGDCKDSSQLLAIMLKEAGIPVALVSLGVRDDGQVLEEVPSPWATHAILVATIAGKQHWIDTTSRLAGWDYLPRDDRDRLCYVIDENNIKLLRTPAFTADDNRTEQTTRIHIGADGSTRCERTAVYHGQAALNRRSDWMDVPAGERRRQLTSELQDANSKSRLSSLQLDEAKLKELDQPVSARIAFEVLEHFGRSQESADEREGNITDSRVWGNLLFVTLDYDRKPPLELDQPFESRHRYIIEVPPYFKLDDRPFDRTVRSKWGFFEATIKEDPQSPNRVEVEYHTRIDQVRVEPADFEAFRKFHEDVMRAFRTWLTLKPARNQAELPLLEALLQLTPGDTALAALVADVHLDNNQAQEARRVLRAARHYVPKNAALGELAVKAADGLKEEEAAFRELIGHFPKETKYQAALAENLVDQGKHAEAAKFLQRVIKAGTNLQQAQASYQLARSAMQQKKPEQALKHFLAAENTDKDSVNSIAALKFKAGIHEHLKKPLEAIEAFKEVLELDSQNSEALEAIYRLELAENNRTKALDYLRRYSVAAGRDANLLAKAADYHWRLDRPEDALELASRSRDIENSALAQRVLGLVYLQRANFAKAAFHLERAEVDAAVLTGLIQSRLALGQLPQAIQDADQAEKIEKPTPELLQACRTTLSLAQRRKVILTDVKVPAAKRDAWLEAVDRLICAEHAWAAGRSPTEVAALLDPAFTDEVELGPAFALRGLLALERGRLTLALNDAERAIALSPDLAGGYHVRGRVRLERAHADTLADLQKAATLSQRQDAVVLHWLAGALHQAGQKAEALAVQQEAVKLRPEDKELAAQLRHFEKQGKSGGS
jgi:tetratricopeptide (TPR) repeat protein